MLTSVVSSGRLALYTSSVTLNFSVGSLARVAKKADQISPHYPLADRAYWQRRHDAWTDVAKRQAGHMHPFLIPLGSLAACQPCIPSLVCQVCSHPVCPDDHTLVAAWAMPDIPRARCPIWPSFRGLVPRDLVPRPPTALRAVMCWMVCPPGARLGRGRWHGPRGAAWTQVW